MRGGGVAAWLIVLAGAIAGVPGAAAHVGFHGGEIVEFRLPLWVVWIAGALVVALSFALVAGFHSREDATHAAYRRAAGRDAAAVHLARGTGFTLLRAAGLLVLVLVVVNAFRPATTSLLPAAVVWLGIWVLLPLLAYTFGDLWPRIDPYRALAPLAERLRGRRPVVPYPLWLGAWPATVLFLALVGVEVAGGAWAVDGALLARIVLAYSLLVVLGMALFGAERWLAEAEVVGRALRWWRAVSPLAWEGGRLRWRGFTAGLAELPVRRLDGAAFTIAVLYGVNFDALMHTRLGTQLFALLAHLHVPFPALVLLVAFYLLFLGAWLIAARAMRSAAEDLAAVPTTAARFAASLLPIAAAYHLAHNLPYLVQNLPLAARAAVDPLGLGGPALALPETITFPGGILPALAGAQIVLIILGHLAAVVAAHRIAAATHPSRVQAVLAETPLTLAMVVYTGLGLALLGAKGVVG